MKLPDDAASNTSNIRKFGGSVVSSERKLSLQLDDDGLEPLSAPPRSSFVSHKRTTSMDSHTDLQALLAEDSSRIMQMNKKLAKKATKCLKGVVKAQADVKGIIDGLRRGIIEQYGFAYRMETVEKFDEELEKRKSQHDYLASLDGDLNRTIQSILAGGKPT